MSKKYRYLDKDVLNKINHISATVFRYNRTIPQSIIDALPDDKVFPIVFEMLHEHRAGKPVETHVRTIIVAPDRNDVMQQLILDMDMALYLALPETEVEDEKKDTPELV